ncbi:MAG: hypothetical protein K5829_00725 [Treponema sp.]|nr:hypothetical protein [Treponema sp.]
MIIVSILLLLFILTPVSYAQELNPLYQLPEKIAGTESESIYNSFLVGSDSGLYRITNTNKAFPLWSQARVDQLVQVKIPNKFGVITDAFIMRTRKGLFYTEDLKNFEERDSGLPFLTIKKYENGSTSLEKQIQELKDLCVNPLNNQEMVTATKDNVYYSRDGGITWKNIGSNSAYTPGIKAVAVASMETPSGTRPMAFMAHAIYGFAYCYLDSEKVKWIDVSAGFEIMNSLTSPDEIADIMPVLRTNADGSQHIEIYISQTYLPRIYRYDIEKKKGVLIYKGSKPVNVIDGLTTIDNVLVYSSLETLGSLDLDSLENPGVPKQLKAWENAFAAVPGMTNTAWVPRDYSGFSKGILLNELWLLYPGTINSPYAEKADGKKSIYASAYQCRTQEGIDKFKKIVKDRNMNSIVIDMKDDYGYFRYDTKNPMLLEKGKISAYAVELDHFIEEFKKDDIYLIARVVTFKDRTLSKYKNGKYAVWDSRLDKPWIGIKGYEDVKDENGNVTGKNTLYYDEHWVDPYSEEVWEYNVEVAKDLISRGFDEIQFDYIRFPTDGTNLNNAQYRWKNAGMDKESALISFLSYARANIDAPVGIDIYGANGWYRSGTRTGQDAEMLAEYVDVIGPMFYPSHFEQSFLNYAPYAERTYRVYYYGTFRNTVLCRNRAIIRPWIQCFYLNVSYDRKYYDSSYIENEFYGVRDSVNRGYMCWNNSGEYGVTPADPGDEAEYPGSSPEASDKYPRPIFGTRIRGLAPQDTDISVLDSILLQYSEEDLAEIAKENSFFPFLQVAPR